jgi:sec-independent protein translocase protein TatA
MGATEIVFIFVVYLLLFGAKGIPSLAKTMGEAVRTFRSATEDIQREILAEDAPKRRDFGSVKQTDQKPAQQKEGTDSINPNMSDGPLDDPRNT